MGATIADLLMPQVPMEKMHKRMGIENPLLKMLADPFMIAGLATGGLAGASALRKAAKNKGVRRQLAAGFMPREAAEKTVLKGSVVHPDEAIPAGLGPDDMTKMGGMDVVKTGQPMRMYHGTQTPFGRVTQESVDAVPENLYGPGYYQSSSGRVTSEYALGKAPRGPSKGLEYAPNVRTSFADIRNPFDVEKTFQRGDPDLSPGLAGYLGPEFDVKARLNRRMLDIKYKQAQDIAENLASTRRMADRKSDPELMGDIMELMAVERENLPVSNRPLWKQMQTDPKAQDVVALKAALDKPPSQLNVPGGSVDELDETLFKIGDIGEAGESAAELAARPEVQAMMPKIRQMIRTLGDESYTRLGDEFLQPPSHPTLTGQEVFNKLKSGVGASPPPESLANLLQGASTSGYAKSQKGMDFEMVREALKRSGFDSLIHRGGRDGREHLVNVAWDPSQVYLPYIADEFRGYRPEAAGGLLSAILGGIGAARPLSSGRRFRWERQ